MKLKKDLSIRQKKIFLWLFNMILVVLVTLVVYFTGGVSLSYTHLMYIPILMTAFGFNVYLTIIMALFAGLLLGPWMPQNVGLNIAQEPLSWLFRTLMFVVIGVFGSLLMKRLTHFRNLELNRIYTNELTQFPNLTKLKQDIEHIIQDNQTFTVLGFRITNLNSIRQNYGYDIGTKAMIQALKMLDKYQPGKVYSIYGNEIILLLPNHKKKEALKIGRAYLDEISHSIYVDSYKIGFIMCASILNYPDQIESSKDVLKKLEIILDQNQSTFKINDYDEAFDEKNKQQAEVVADLLEAIQRDEFTLVYQPIIALSGKSIYEAEALVRWHHPVRGIVNPAMFIPIAEETGLIGEITKLVLKKVVEQGNIWKQQGYQIKTSVNLSAKDFENKDILNYLKHIISDEVIDPSLLELEVTERAVIEKLDELIELFNELRKMHIKISIDDFGTGYNSFIHLVRIPMDYIKIDKSFIDHIEQEKYEIMIGNLIRMAHNMGIKVIAEGVENQMQYDILKRLNCDYIQGYYIQRPLTPNKLISFYEQNNKKSDY